MTSRFDLRTPARLVGRERDFRLLLAAGVVSMSGDWLLGVGLSYAVYAVTGSTLASAVTLLAAFVPQVLAGLVAGVFVDRWDRRRTMVACNVILAGGLLPLLLVSGVHQIWIVYVVVAVESTVEVFFAPAEQALLPTLVDDADLVVANGLNTQAQQVARLVGSGLGGVVAAIGGIPAVAAADAVTFAVAAVLIAAIRVRDQADAPTEDAAPSEGSTGLVRGRLAQLHVEWREGLATAWQSPVVRMLLVFGLVTSVGEGIMGTLFAPYVRAVLHSGPQVLGVVSGVQAVGGILGGLVVASLGSRWSPVVMLGAGAVLFGLVDLAIFLYPLWLVSPWPAIVGMAVVGVPGAVTMGGFMTLFQRNTVDEQRGRVFGLIALVRSVSVVVGTVAAGLLGESVGIVPVLSVQGIGYVVAGLVVLVVLGRGGSATSDEPLTVVPGAEAATGPSAADADRVDAPDGVVRGR